MLDGIIYDVHMKELITKCYIKKDLLQRFLFSEPIPGISLASAWWAFVLKYDPQKTICKRFLFLTVYKKAEQLYTKQQVTRNNKWFNEWQRMTPSVTSGKEWHNEWLTTSGPTSDNNWQQMTSDNHWQRVRVKRVQILLVEWLVFYGNFLLKTSKAKKSKLRHLY